jgi:regulator of protease activity HflC (stomatin/prohibitin superfamily)
MITKDNLNCIVDGQVYYKVKEDPDQIKNAIYKVNDYKYQIVQLAQTTLRNVIGGNQFKEVNSNRKVLNNLVFESIKDKTDSWAIEIVRVELKEIDPPEDVQSTMNEIIKAENTRDANKDFALARAIEAEGIANAAIKSAEGEKRSLQLRAEGQALAIKEVALARAKEIEYVNNAAKTYFVDNAVLLKQLEVTQASLQNNTKIVLTKDGISPTLVLSEEQKIIPVKENPKTAGDK